MRRVPTRVLASTRREAGDYWIVAGHRSLASVIRDCPRARPRIHRELEPVVGHQTSAENHTSRTERIWGVSRQPDDPGGRVMAESSSQLVISKDSVPRADKFVEQAN